MKSWSIVVIVLLVPLTGHASEIRQRTFSYSLESVTAKADDHFVVCSDCSDNRLSMMPMTPKLALHMTTPLKLEVSESRGLQPVQSNKDDVVVQAHLAPIQFDFNNAKLSSREHERLNGLLEELPKNSTFDLTGYTCTIGSSHYNEELSIRRANHVAGIFMAKGLNVGSIEGKGKCCPVSNEKRLNRRVEILEHRKGEK